MWVWLAADERRDARLRNLGRTERERGQRGQGKENPAALLKGRVGDSVGWVEQ
jgi:hypothetical protein